MRYKKVCVEAFGYEIPETVVTSQSLEERVAPIYEKLNLSYGRFELMTGIRERRFWDDKTTSPHIREAESLLWTLRIDDRNS